MKWRFICAGNFNCSLVLALERVDKSGLHKQRKLHHAFHPGDEWLVVAGECHEHLGVFFAWRSRRIQRRDKFHVATRWNFLVDQIRKRGALATWKRGLNSNRGGRGIVNYKFCLMLRPRLDHAKVNHHRRDCVLRILNCRFRLGGA